MAKLGSWSTTSGSNNSTPPDGWPEGQAPSTVNDCAREMMARIREVFNDAQFFDQNLTPTFINTTSFSVAGNQTSAIHAGRRLKIFDGTAGVATTIYATVLTASFTVVTTISISADGGQLTSSLSSFAMSILSNNNSALPRTLGANSLSAENVFVGGTLTVSSNTVVKGFLTIRSNVDINPLNGNAGLEIGNQNGTATQAFVDFHSGAVLTDFDARIVAEGGTGVDGGGSLSVIAAATTFTGNINGLGRLSVSGTVIAQNVAKAWGVFSVGVAPTIITAFNFNSISRSSTGVYRCNFAISMSDANFASMVFAPNRYVGTLGANVTFVKLFLIDAATDAGTDATTRLNVTVYR